MLAQNESFFSTSKQDGESSWEEETDSDGEGENRGSDLQQQEQLQQQPELPGSTTTDDKHESAEGKGGNQLDDSSKPFSNITPGGSMAAQPLSAEAQPAAEAESMKKAAEGGQMEKKETESPLPMVRKFVTHEDAKTAFKELLREKVMT